MHSSGMRTARLLPVSPSMHCCGGCTCQGVPFWVGVPARGVYLPRYSPRGETDTCKNITFANFVCER